MKKIIIILIGIIVIVVVGFGIYKFVLRKNSIADTPLNATYNVAGQDYKLINGRAERKAPEPIGSPLAEPVKESIVSIWGIPIYADLNNDGVNDSVMFLTQTTGGNEVFYYIVEL
jgi:hypothetical protein